MTQVLMNVAPYKADAPVADPQPVAKEDDGLGPDEPNWELWEAAGALAAIALALWLFWPSKNFSPVCEA